MNTPSVASSSASAPAPSPAATPRHYAVWPQRVPHSLVLPATSLWTNLAVSALRYPDKPALVFFGRVLTYRALMQQTERIAAFLHRAGVRKGDRVAVLMQNCPQLVAAHFAILRADAVVVPVNPMNKAEELRHYLSDSGARVAFTTADLAGELAAASNTLPAGERLQHLVVSDFSDAFDADVAGPDAMPEAWRAWLLGRHAAPALPEGGTVHAWATVQACADTPPPHTAGPGDLALLPYTSGTTGLPKGCEHSHGTLMANTVAGNVWNNATATNVTLLVLPLFHITGLITGMHCNVYAGATLVIMPRWDRDLAGRLISRWRVTHWANIPTMVIDLLGSPHFRDYDLGSLRYIGGGGTAMPQAIAQRLLDEFGLRYLEGYGLTETAAPSHSNPPDAPRQQCLGIPYIGTDARIVDPETLAQLPVGEQGEIVVHGPQVFLGYWRQPEATAAAFIDIEGRKFFRTGDLGRMDEDGYFYMADRLKRMINASGFKVWPAEVEALMFRHPAVQEVCVIGTHDAYRGESVKAFVVLRVGQESVTSADITAWCRDNMAVYKAPKVVEIVDALPKTGSGKILWRALQEAETAKTAAAARAAAGTTAPTATAP